MRQPPFSSVTERVSGIFLMSTIELRVDDVGAHLDEEIGSSRQHPRLARRPREQGHRSLYRIRCLISHEYSLAFPWCVGAC